MQYTGKTQLAVGAVETYTLDYSLDKDAGDSILSSAVTTPANATGGQVVGSTIEGSAVRFFFDAGQVANTDYDVTLKTSWASGRITVDAIKVMVR